MEDYNIRKFPNGWIVVCWDREINRRGLIPVYQFTYWDKDGKVLFSGKSFRGPCSRAPEGAARVRVIVWGQLFGVTIMPLGWGRRVNIPD